MPKLVRSNGAVFEIRDVGPVIFRLSSPDKRTMIKPIDAVMEDDEARELCRELLAMDLYEGGKV